MKTEYLITKREPCPNPECLAVKDRESGAAVIRTGPDNPCDRCSVGFVHTEVNLLDVLKQIFVLGEPLADLPTKIQVLPDHAWIGDDEPPAAEQLARVREALSEPKSGHATE